MKHIKLTKKEKAFVLRNMVMDIYGAYIHDNDEAYKDGLLRGIFHYAHMLDLSLEYAVLKDLVIHAKENYFDISGMGIKEDEAFLNKMEINKECYLNGEVE